MNYKILLFTSNVYGGIIQFTTTIFSNLVKLGYEVYCAFPDNAQIEDYLLNDERIILYSTQNSRIRLVEKISRVQIRNKTTDRVCKIVDSIRPDLIWFMDDPLLSLEIAYCVSKKYKTLITLHDANSGHPSHLSLYYKLIDMFYMNLKYRVEKKVDKILLLSNNSRSLFIESIPKLERKTCLMKLGAHIPNVEEKKPKDICKEPYFLFFGRIDKYKGIEIMLRAFSANDTVKTKLVIAGEGTFTDAERKLLDDERIVLLQRFISDNEMLWLFKNATAIILPYIQATQSGVIPIAYTFGVPVIVSNVEGLTQSVIDKKTGFICNNENEYVEAMALIENVQIRAEMGKNALKYSKENYNWEENITLLMKDLGVER